MSHGSASPPGNSYDASDATRKAAFLAERQDVQPTEQRVEPQLLMCSIIVAMTKYHDLVNKVEWNVSSSGFRVSRDVLLADGRTADLVASRSMFSWKKLEMVSQHIFLRHAPTASVADFRALADSGFLHATRDNHVTLVRGLLFSYLLIPCIAVDSGTPDLFRFVSNPPGNRWALVEYPVLYDLSTGRTHCREDFRARFPLPTCGQQSSLISLPEDEENWQPPTNTPGFVNPDPVVEIKGLRRSRTTPHD